MSHTFHNIEYHAREEIEKNGHLPEDYEKALEVREAMLAVLGPVDADPTRFVYREDSIHGMSLDPGGKITLTHLIRENDASLKCLDLPNIALFRDLREGLGTRLLMCRENSQFCEIVSSITCMNDEVVLGGAVRWIEDINRNEILDVPSSTLVNGVLNYRTLGALSAGGAMLAASYYPERTFSAANSTAYFIYHTLDFLVKRRGPILQVISNIRSQNQ